MLLDGRHIAQCQALGPMRPRPHPIDITVTGLDPDEILPQAADLLLNLLRGALPDRDTTDEGRDADTDAQHAEHTPEPIARQGTQGDTQDQPQRHRLALRRT